MTNEALLVVDVQNDFVTGSLAVAGGISIIPAINDAITEFVAASTSIPIFFSADWHIAQHPSFQDQGGPWPPHCIMHTWGAEFDKRLALPALTRHRVIRKGIDAEAYSAFDQPNLNKLLRNVFRVDALTVCGIATDYCVKATVLDALKLNYHVTVLKNGIAAVDPTTGDTAIDEMQRAGAVFV